MKSNGQYTVLLVGPVPPPWFGQAIALRTLLDSPELGRRFRLVSVNTNNVGNRRAKRIVSTLSALYECARKLIAHRPQVVYLMVTRSRLGSVKDCIFIMLAALWGAKVVVHLHGGDLAVFYRSLGPVGKRLLRSVYGRVSLAVVLGESLRSQFEGLVPSDRVRVVFNCWSDGELDLSSRQEARSPEEPLRVAFVSHVLPSKGLYDALEGLAWALCRGVKVEFCFAGEFLGHDGAIAKLPQLVHENLPARALERKYERMVKALEIENCVRRLGVVTGPRKWTLLAQTDILLLPIYNPTEGQPLVAIEAMRAGCALIATQCGGLVDIVEDGVTGRVVRPRAPQEIGEAIGWFWENPQALAHVARVNADRAQRLHSPQEHIRQIVHVLEEALDGPSNGRKNPRSASCPSRSCRSGVSEPQRQS